MFKCLSGEVSLHGYRNLLKVLGPIYSFIYTVHMFNELVCIYIYYDIYIPMTEQTYSGVHVEAVPNTCLPARH